MQDDELSVVVTHQPVAIPSGDTDDDGDDEVIPIKVSVLPLHFFCTHHAAYVIYIVLITKILGFYTGSISRHTRSSTGISSSR